jgi:hypothetical protein
VVQQIQLPGGQPSKLRLASDTLVIAVTESHLVVLGLSTPTNPDILLDLSLPEITDGDIKGIYLFVTHGVSLYTYDVTSWQNPILIDSLFWSIGFCGVRVVGDLLLVEIAYTDNCDFLIYKIAYPAPLVQNLLYHWVPPGYFAIDFEFADSVGIFVFDLQGTRSIQTFVLSQATGVITPLWTSGELVERTPWSLAVSDSIVSFYTSRTFVSKPTSIVTAKLTQTGSLTFLDTLDLGLNRTEIIVYVDRPIDIAGRITLWSTREGIACGTLGDDTRLLPRGFLKTHERCLSVQGYQDTIYALTIDRLYAFDFRTASDPDTLGTLGLVAEGMTLVDRSTLLAFDSILTLIDLSDLSQLEVLDTLHLGRNRSARNAAAHDSLVAIAALEHGTFIGLLRNDTLSIASWLPVHATDVAWRGDTLLIAETDNFMSIWSLDDPFNPEFLSYLPGQSGSNYSLSTMDNLMAVGSSPFVYLYDISSIANPVLINQQFLYGGTILRHRFFDGIFYTSGDGSRFSAFTLDDSLYFTTIASADYPQSDGTFFANDTTVFVPTGLAGLRVVLLDTTIASVSHEGDQHPWEFVLFPNYPNPFNPVTTFEFQLAGPGLTVLSVYDILGREVATIVSGHLSAGRYRQEWDASGLASGVYFARLVTSQGSLTGKLIIQK